MTGNPFHRSLDDRFRGRRVQVTSNQGATYVGWVERIHHHDRHVVLVGARREDAGGKLVGNVMVAHADSIVEAPPEKNAPRHQRSRVELVDVHAVEPSPWHVREFDRAANVDYIADVARDGWVGSYPVVRATEMGHEIVAGHKRFWAAREAGLAFHPAEVRAVSGWEARQLFLQDHLPTEADIGADGTPGEGCYTDAETRACIELLAEHASATTFELPVVRFNVERLGLADEVAADTEQVRADGGTDVRLAFADAYVEPILEGEKTVTVRYQFEHDLKPGQLVALVDESDTLFASARIVTQCELRADWISYADFAGHRRYTTTGELLDDLARHYPDAEIHWKTPLDVIAFHVLVPRGESDGE